MKCIYVNNRNINKTITMTPPITPPMWIMCKDQMQKLQLGLRINYYDVLLLTR